MVDLDPDGDWAPAGVLRVRAFGVSGDVTERQAPGDRDDETPMPYDGALAAALAESQTDVEYELLLRLNVPPRMVAENLYGDADDSVLLEIAVPLPPERVRQVLLLSTPGGVLRWGLEPDGDGDAHAVYRVTRNVLGRDPLAAEPGEYTRVTLVVRVLRYDTKPFSGAIGFVTRRWERLHVSERFRMITPRNYAAKHVDPLRRADWNKLASGPALLFVHGTFSSTRGALKTAPRSLIDDWTQKYEERVFGWDHRTVGPSPRRNADWAAAHIPDDVTLELDVVAHSRGGLVARELTERMPKGLAGRIRVRDVITLGTPHDGTPLADPRHTTRFLDVITSLLLVGGQPGLALAIQTVKHVAVRGFEALSGLTAMTPDGDYLRDLNRSRRVRADRYVAVGSAYRPDRESAIARVARDLAVDGYAFGGPNDMVVPTDSATATLGRAPTDAVARQLEVCHSDYLRSPLLTREVSRAFDEIDQARRVEAPHAHAHPMTPE